MEATEAPLRQPGEDAALLEDSSLYGDWFDRLGTRHGSGCLAAALQSRMHLCSCCKGSLLLHNDVLHLKVYIIHCTVPSELAMIFTHPHAYALLARIGCLQGRGYSLPADIALMDARFGPGAPAVVMPMREIMHKEAAFYCR